MNTIHSRKAGACYTSLLLLGLASTISARAQTVLSAGFESDRILAPPDRRLPGFPTGDELLVLGPGSNLRVVPFPATAGHRALRILPSPGTHSGLVELKSAILPPGGRSRVLVDANGQLNGKDTLVISLSRDSRALLGVLELQEGKVYAHELAADGTTRTRRLFATSPFDRAHHITADLEVRTGKIRYSFQPLGGPISYSPTLASPGAAAVGNALNVSLVYNYSELLSRGGNYFLDDAKISIIR